MYQQSSEMTVSPNYASSPTNSQGLPSANSVPNSESAYEEILSEKRSRWMFRVQFCLFLSLLAHIALFAYIHDKYILLKIVQSDNIPLVSAEKEKTLPMPIQEPRAIPGYDESRLDSPEIKDSIEQLTPTSPAEEQEFNDEKPDPSVDDFNSMLVDEIQTPDSPELSEVPNVTPIAINEIEAPTEEVQPDISRTYNTDFNPSNINQSVSASELASAPATIHYEAPQSDFGAVGQLKASSESAKVVLDAGDSDIIRPTSEDPTIIDSPSDDLLSESGNQIPEQTVSSVPIQIRPSMSVHANSYMLAKETDILQNASSTAPKAQARMTSPTGPRGLPRASYNSPTAYNDLTAKDISQSIILDSPQNSTSVPVPRDYNAGQGGLNGKEFKSLEPLPESDISIDAQSAIALNRNSIAPSTAYLKRAPSLRMQTIASFGGDTAINQTIENGLKYLSKTQWPDGRWRFHSQPPSVKGNPQNGNIKCDTAATALALLSMLGAGYTHKEGPYKKEIQKGLEFLLANQQTTPIVGTNGVKGAIGAIYDLNDNNESQYNYRSYAHAMSTIALCEAYGLTHDPKLFHPAQAAVKYIIETQNKNLGGWRYETQGQEGQPHLESDTSVTGWQVMALRSAIAANVLKSEDVIPSLNISQKWLNRAQNPETKRYIYNPYNGTNSQFTHWKKITPSMTAEGLFIQWCINPDLLDTQQTIPYLLNNLPGLQDDSDYSRDVYYWYYGTAIMFVQKGQVWNKWQSAIMPLLKDTQLPQNDPFAGSWDTEKPTIDKWSNYGGRHYITTMNLMILEIYTRHLSIYQ